MDSVELIHLKNQIDWLYGKLETLLKEIVKPAENKYRSTEINELASALAKAQGEFKIADKSKENPYFKSSYADLTDYVEASRPALTKYGLSVTQDIISHDDGSTMCYTTLHHSSGQWKSSSMRVTPPKSDVQSLSSYLSYIKRMAYASLVGVVARDNSDDDGEIAVAPTRELMAKGTAINTKYNPTENTYDTISKDQLDMLEYELSEYPDIATQVLNGLQLQNLADMPKSKFQISIQRIREIKLARNGK